MKIQNIPPLHLTYCLNVHPGESWAENLQAIRTHAMGVRKRVQPEGPFGLGLRLGAQAADELAEPDRLTEFRDFLQAENLYVFTINGFPYGQFHDTAVKADVYAPDWRTPQRRDYTRKLADILSQLLPEGVSGSISTVPGSYGRWVQSEEDVEAMCLMLCDVLMHLRRLRTRTGRDICLALEPEPDCFVETTEQVIEFLTGPMQRAAREFFKLQAGLEDEQADEILQRHLGVCFDCAHQAVQFEDLSRCLLQLRSSGVRIAKVHLSAAFEAAPSPEARKQLETFVEPVYLHQTKVERPGGEIVAYSDLPDALAGEDPQGRWRVHFHVPLFFESDGALGSTRRLLKGQFAQLLKSGFAEHLEIETYTFGVLPDNMAITDPADAIAREYQWVLGDLLALR